MAGNNNTQNTSGVGGTNLGTYIDSLRQRATQLNNDMLTFAQNQTDNTGLQIALITQQIDVINRRNNIETLAARRNNVESRDRRTRLLDERRDTELNTVMAERAANQISRSQARSRTQAIEATHRSGRAAVERDYSSGSASIASNEQENELLVQLMRENVNAVNNASQQQVRQMARGDNTIVEAIHTGDNAPLNDLSDTHARVQAREEWWKGNKETFKAISDSKVIETVIAGGRKLASGENGFDMIVPASETAGKLAGMALGAIVGEFLGGPGAALAGAKWGGDLGEALMGGISEFEKRKATAMESFLVERNKFRAMANFPSQIEIPDMEQFGMGPEQTMQLMNEVSKRARSVDHAYKYTEDIGMIIKATNLTQDALFNLIDIQSSNPEDSKSIAGLVGGIRRKAEVTGIMKKGDEAYLNEFAGKFAEVQRAFLQTHTTFGTASTMDIIGQFHRLGGAFDMRDPRGLPNMMAVQNGLSHPGSDSLKALSFITLRRLNPSAGLFDILEQQEQGISGPNGPALFKNMLQYAHNMGGDFGKLFLKETLPQLSYSNIRHLYNSRDVFSESIEKGYMEKTDVFYGDIYGNAVDNTTELEHNTAKISKSLLGTDMETLGALSAALYNAITDTFKGATIEVKDGKIIIPENSTSARMFAVTPSLYRQNAGNKSPKTFSRPPAKGK